MTAPDYVVYDPDGRIVTEVRCVSCGHFLCGLRPEAQCGECGSPVAWSLRGEVFLSADADWLAAVRSGTAELAMLAPWAWLPLTWPWIGWAMWKASRPIPGGGSAEGVIHSSAMRLMMALFPMILLALLIMLLLIQLSPGGVRSGLSIRAKDLVVPAVAALGGAALFAGLACLVLRRLGQGHPGRRFRKLTAVLSTLMILAGLLLIGSAFARAIDIQQEEWIATLIGGGIAIAIVCLPWFFGALALAWRMIAASSVQANGLRDRPPFWQKAEPGRAAEPAR